jgi:hypothetical protein
MLALIALVGAVQAGVGVAGTHGQASGCTVTSSTVQPFLPWNDSNNYFLAPGGSMESNLSSTGWTLTGGAGLVSGSESYDVTGNPADSKSLGLPTGSSAQSAAICVTIQDPELRFFVMNTGNSAALLNVTSVFTGNDGKRHTMSLAAIHGGSSWSLSDPIKFKNSIQPGADGTGLVAFVFTPADKKGNWRIDDLYIDPIKHHTH